MFPILTLSSSVLALLFIALSIKVVSLRKKHHVSIGTANHNDLEMAVRAHGNFSEYTPIMLIISFIAEANQVSGVPLSLLMLFFIVGRFMHAYSFLYSTTSHLKIRIASMMLTFISITLVSLINLAYILYQCSRSL
jgi:uncharacterized membrane protein YecN with MAPEG domain